MTCSFCGSEEGVAPYWIKQRGWQDVIMSACVACAEIERQKKDVLEVTRVEREEA